MAEEVVSFIELSDNDAPKIAAAIPRLARLGLKPVCPEHEFLDVARRITEEWAGVSVPDDPLSWCQFALRGSPSAFSNAVHHSDHCYDVADEEDYAEVVASIIDLAGDEWPIDSVSATKVVREGRNGPSQRMDISIHAHEGGMPFELIAAKDFDWSVVTRLNERLPPAATGRFAAFFDGSATIVYLKPDQLEALGRFLGYNFVSEIEPLAERPRARSYIEAGLDNPLPVWAMVGSCLMGMFLVSQLLVMIVRGAPYAISGGIGDTPIYYAQAPFEFTLWVTFLVFAAVFFLGGPLFLIVERRRLRRVSRKRSRY